MARVNSSPLDWPAERDSWPHAAASSFHVAGGLRWHVQRMGSGPELLLVHGTGASAHSWRGLAPLLAKRFTVIAPDLPGHGFTQRPPAHRLSLPAMAEALESLVDALSIRPMIAVGHSAGAAILIRACLNEGPRDGFVPRGLVSVNGALLPFRGAAGYLFPPLAKLLFLNPLAPRVFARRARLRERVARLVRGTGSELDAAGIELYARLFETPGHVAAALGMMANWDLHGLAGNLGALDLPLLLIAGENDRAVVPDDAGRVSAMVPGSRVERLRGLGHLAHEEDPDAVASLIGRFADEVAA